MPVITYTALDRGELASGHSALTSYQIETRLEGYPRSVIFKGEREETLDGQVESWLDAIQYRYQVQTDLVLLADREDWREFFSSIINGEQFQIDFTGTIASPGTDINVTLESTQIEEQQIGGVGVKYAFSVKVHP